MIREKSTFQDNLNNKFTCVELWCGQLSFLIFSVFYLNGRRHDALLLYVDLSFSLSSWLLFPQPISLHVHEQQQLVQLFAFQ